MINTDFRKIVRFGLISVFVFFFLFIPQIIEMVSNFYFFHEVGFEQIFSTMLSVKIGLFFVGLIVGFGILFANWWFALKSKVPWVASVPGIVSPTGRAVVMTQDIAKKLMIGIGLFIGFIVGMIVSGEWELVMRYINQVSFGVSDPIFGHDVSWYMFSVPFFLFWVRLIKGLLVMGMIGSVVLYLLRGMLFSFGGWKNMLNKLKGLKSQVRWHLGLGVMLWSLLTATDLFFSRYELLLQEKTVLFGVSYVDANIVLPLILVSVGALILLAFASGFMAVKGNVKFLGGMIVLFFGVGLVRSVAPALVQQFVVTPNELIKETPYIEHHIKATRDAYGLEKVEEVKLSGDQSLTSEDITNNPETIRNVRLWDRAPLLSTFSQIQAIRTYYEFNNVTNDRYMVNGELRQLMLSPRELDSESLPTQNWINSHLTFTHGYGITAGPVNQVTDEGLPVLMVKDLPPQSEIEELQVTRPEIYYGRIANEYVIVNTESAEFDYPKGDEQVYTNYAGEGGVKLDSWWKRVLFAVKFGSLNIILNGDINKDSRVLYNRQIENRVKKLVPFLTWDHDPYMVVADGRLYWVMDGYSVSDKYPYAKRVILGNKRVNYVRNSVKVVVDAYDGKVKMYVADAEDPIIQVYQNIFPDVFESYSDIPESLKAHMRYPEDIFRLQTSMYSIFHMTEPQIFYNREDQWEIPVIATDADSAEGRDGQLTPRHMIMRLPDEESAEYILMQPFTPRAKDNLAAWMVARNDGDQYGKLKVYAFPKDRLVYGPKQVIGRINQDSDVARQITLWDQRGSQVIQGPLLVIPIESSLLYVRPLYLKASDGKIPELKRVIVAYENQISMEANLQTAIEKIFGGSVDVQNEIDEDTIFNSNMSSTNPESKQNLDEAKGVYDRAMEALRNGEWGKFGDEMERLGEILQ